MHQRQDGFGIGRTDGGLAFACDITGKPDSFAYQFTTPIQGPFVAVGVNEVGEVLEALPLLPVAAL